MSHKTIKETLAELSELTGKPSNTKGYTVILYELQRDSGRSHTLPVVELHITFRRKSLTKSNMELKVTVDSPCGLTGLSPREAQQLAFHHTEAAILAAKAEDIVSGLSWDQTEMEMFYKGEA